MHRRDRRVPASDRYLTDPILWAYFLKPFVTGFPSAARLGHPHQLLNLLVERMALGDDLIDDAEGSGILSRQEIVAVESLFDGSVVLAGVADIDLVQAPLHLDDVFGVAFDIARLTLEAARG